MTIETEPSRAWRWYTVC